MATNFINALLKFGLPLGAGAAQGGAQLAQIDRRRRELERQTNLQEQIRKQDFTMDFLGQLMRSGDPDIRRQGFEQAKSLAGVDVDLPEVTDFQRQIGQLQGLPESVINRMLDPEQEFEVDEELAARIGLPPGTSVKLGELLDARKTVSGLNKDQSQIDANKALARMRDRDKSKTSDDELLDDLKAANSILSTLMDQGFPVEGAEKEFEEALRLVNDLSWELAKRHSKRTGSRTSITGVTPDG